ncbi:hypothetical protein PAHAL_9G419000 [Panicum hallii]|jgi:hypothetical protein|uniref:Uncharacterized protein n=1 Tax=Panicum hallii TaxID=206008 RepID=A0A2S3IPH0_9POAL|nr:trinucleotide repeat-containing gene 18 protein-like [Panicum hallii]PAN49008.1 hypothetical protein PAHAL_9G419000 [Panicum hallii]
MQKQEHPISCSLPPSNQNSKKPSMASQERTAPTGRSGGADDVRSHTDAGSFGNDPASSAAPEDFEFCILSSGGLALAGEDAADMCVADEVFSGGKLLPFRLSSATSGDALLRSDSLDGSATTASTSGFSSSSVSRSASSSSSSSCVSRSTSSKSASSDPAGLGSCPPNRGATADAAVPPRRSLSGSVFYAHPSPSPRPPRRSARPAAAPAPRRSTGSAPPASWGLIRLGVVGAAEVYAPRPAGYRKAAAASARGGSRSARFDQPRTAPKEDKKLALGLLGAGLVCSCSPDAVAPVGSAEVAAAEARRRRKMAEEKKRAAKQSGRSTARRSRILEWLEELSISKDKSVV